MYQKLQIIGHVGKDPEMRYTPSGQAVAKFSVATNRKWTGSDGQPKEETIWFNISVWSKLAETCNQYVTKGLLVMCEGRLPAQINIWTDQTGVARASYDLTADTVKFLGGGAGRGNEGAENEGGYQQAAGGYAPRQTNQPAYKNQAAPARTAPQPVNTMPQEPPYGGSNDDGINGGEIPF